MRSADTNADKRWRLLTNALQFQETLADGVGAARVFETSPQSFDGARIHKARNSRLPSFRRAKPVDGVDDVLCIEVGLRGANIKLLVVCAVEAERVQHQLQLHDVAADVLFERSKPQCLAGGVIDAS